MVQYTKKAIAESFMELLNERPFDKISVVDIAEKCGINRNTFYYYYADVYALVDDVFRMETQRIIDENVAFTSWQEAFMQGTGFARANRRARPSAVSRSTCSPRLRNTKADKDSA